VLGKLRIRIRDEDHEVSRRSAITTPHHASEAIGAKNAVRPPKAAGRRRHDLLRGDRRG